MQDTGALRPKPNPAYRPRPEPNATHISTEGLVPRGCELAVTNGTLQVLKTGPSPFLGIAGWKHPGPYVLELGARCSTGGVGSVRWSLTGASDFNSPGNSVEFSWPSGPDWREVLVQVPITGQPRVIRVYPPAAVTCLELTHLRWCSADGSVRTWEFSALSR